MVRCNPARACLRSSSLRLYRQYPTTREPARRGNTCDGSSGVRAVAAAASADRRPSVTAGSAASIRASTRSSTSAAAVSVRMRGPPEPATALHTRSTERKRLDLAGHEVLARLGLGHDRRRKPVVLLEARHVGYGEIRLPRGRDTGVRPVRHPMGAHALAEFPHAVQQHRYLSRRVLVVGAARKQALAGPLRRLVLGAADSELLRGRELSVAGWIGEVRHAVRAHAAGEGEQLGTR